MFQETGDTGNFQSRYVLHHPFKGPLNCPNGAEYQKRLVIRQSQEAQTLAQLTGWELPSITEKMRHAGQPADTVRLRP